MADSRCADDDAAHAWSPRLSVVWCGALRDERVVRRVGPQLLSTETNVIGGLVHEAQIIDATWIASTRFAIDAATGSSSDEDLRPALAHVHHGSVFSRHARASSAARGATCTPSRAFQPADR